MSANFDFSMFCCILLVCVAEACLRACSPAAAALRRIGTAGLYGDTEFPCASWLTYEDRYFYVKADSTNFG